MIGTTPQCFCGVAFSRDRRIRKVEQRNQNKWPLVQTRVGQGDAATMADPVAVKQEIEIERARRFRIRACAPVFTLDTAQRSEQFVCRQQGVERDNRVEVRWLSPTDTLRCGTVETRLLNPLRLRQCGELRYGALKMVARITAVTAEADVSANRKFHSAEAAVVLA
jgi:hypothetical protein